MDKLIQVFDSPRKGIQELVFPDIRNTLINIKSDDNYIDYRISRDPYSYTINVFLLYYDTIVADREQIDKWARALYNEGSFVFIEYQIYLAIRRSEWGAVRVINPKTGKDFMTPRQRSDHIDAIDKDMQSIIGLVKQNGNEFYVHRENYKVDVGIQKVISECIAKKSDILDSLTFDIDEDTHLSAPQRAVIDHVNNNNVTIATGGAGTGKTTIIVAIIKSAIKQDMIHRLRIIAPTHMAANNIRMRLYDIFKSSIVMPFIGTIGEFGFREKQHPSGALLIFEESSMYDNILGQILAVNAGNYYDCKYLFIGDPNQLRPPTRNSIFKNIIAKNKKFHVHLSHNYRSGDIIIKNSERVVAFSKARKVIFDINQNFVVTSTESTTTDLLPQLAIEKYYKDLGPDNVMFITHRNIDVIAVNRYLREHYFAARGFIINTDVMSETRTHPIHHRGKIIGSWEWRVGDKARCKINRKAIFNGSICTVRGFEGNSIVVEYNNQHFNIDHQHLWPAYCITVHNSQGQEWERVVFCSLSTKPISSELLYVAITRGKKHVAIARVCDDLTITEFDLEIDDQDETER